VGSRNISSTALSVRFNANSTTVGLMKRLEALEILILSLLYDSQKDFHGSCFLFSLGSMDEAEVSTSVLPFGFVWRHVSSAL
jgi:hypothetical protein